MLFKSTLINDLDSWAVDKVLPYKFSFTIILSQLEPKLIKHVSISFNNFGSTCSPIKTPKIFSPTVAKSKS